MKPIALVLIACAGLGLAARQPVLPNGSRRSEPVRPALKSEAGPVETPLVEKLLPAVPESLRAKPSSGLSNADIVKIYSDNEAAIAAIWMEDESYTMRDAVELWCKREHNESAALWLKRNATLPKPPTVKQSLTVQDGQLSPRGEWRWSQSQGAWVPVAKAGPRWVENGHSATIEHLVREHGYSRASLERLTQAQLDQLHSNAHNLARKSIVNQDSPCPGGRCPAPSYSRGLFGRRR